MLLPRPLCSFLFLLFFVVVLCFVFDFGIFLSPNQKLMHFGIKKIVWTELHCAL